MKPYKSVYKPVVVNQAYLDKLAKISFERYYAKMLARKPNDPVGNLEGRDGD